MSSLAHYPLSSDDLNALESVPPTIVCPALSRVYLCDNFALLLEEEELQKKMKEYSGAAVNWKILLPEAPTRLIPRYQTSVGDCSHSVLVVKGRNDWSWVIDCSCEQFGWERSSWVLSLRDFSARKATPEMWFASNKERSSVEQGVRVRDSGFEVIVQEWMEDLSTNLPWNRLMLLPGEIRVSLVSVLARRAFVGAFGTAFRRL
jgi:hypothetical protein